MKAIFTFFALALITTTTLSARTIETVIDGERFTCTSSSYEPQSCVAAAYNGPFSKTEALDLCEGARNIAPAKCAIEMYRGPFSKSEAIEFCRGARFESKSECFTLAYSGPFSKTESTELCRSPFASKSTAECALNAYRGPYSKEESIRICRDYQGLAKSNHLVGKRDQEQLIIEANTKAFHEGVYKK